MYIYWKQNLIDLIHSATNLQSFSYLLQLIPSRSKMFQIPMSYFTYTIVNVAPEAMPFFGNLLCFSCSIQQIISANGTDTHVFQGLFVLLCCAAVRKRQMIKKMAEEAVDKTITVGVFGDDTSGKTSIVRRYVDNVFTTEGYVPQMEHNKNVFLSQFDMYFQIVDTGYDKGFYLYTTLMGHCNVFVLCFELNKMKSQTIKRLDWWITRLEHYGKDKPILLVGTKLDERNEASKISEFYSTEEGQKTAQKIGAFDYIECSAKENINIPLIFEKIGQFIKEPGVKSRIKQKSSKCFLM